MMHDSSCGCPDCANFHPNRFANVGVPTPSDRSAEERREFEQWASGEVIAATRLVSPRCEAHQGEAFNDCPCCEAVQVRDLQGRLDSQK
jgi:hypothetical protein